MLGVQTYYARAASPAHLLYPLRLHIPLHPTNYTLYKQPFYNNSRQQESKIFDQTFSYFYFLPWNGTLFAFASVAAFAYGKSVSAAVSPETYGGFQQISFPPRSKGYAAMLHRSMLLGKRLPSDPPLEHEGRIHKRLSIMKVCLWLCIYLCLLVLILISCRINGLNYCFFNASPATCSPCSCTRYSIPSVRLILMLSVFEFKLGRPVKLQDSSFLVIEAKLLYRNS